MKQTGIRFSRVVGLAALTAALAVAAPQMSLAAPRATAPVCTCSITVSPASGVPNTLVSIKGSGFVAGGNVRIRFVDSAGTRWAVNKPTSVKVAMNGTFAGKVRVPKLAKKGHGRFVAIEMTGSKRAVARFIVT